ncbi:MAG: glucokinase [Deltaproteobacteria bacterium]|nr:glucokinase [Deltaproteobacteria bacterium]MBN2674670.1 glucokinase [Deltaproteobacteria bacterium]
MEVKWQSENFDQDMLILAGDVGGTNTNLAVVGKKDGKYTIIVECVFKSSEVTDLIGPVEETLKTAAAKSAELKPSICCISAAGPVADNVCVLTNCSWNVDGNAIEAKTGMKTLVINDFLAIGYGIPTLDVTNPEQITQLKNTDGELPVQTGTTKAVVGAGTGLGVGFLTESDGVYTACPSEGGHSGFAPFDEDSIALTAYMTEKLGIAPGTEPFVSGQGIANIFNFLNEKKGIATDELCKEIAALDDADKPAKIAMNADNNAVCKQVMESFVKMYGKFAGSMSLVFMCAGGMYLAGGIVTKNEKYLVENDLFMKYFEMNYKPNIAPLLKKTPVYIIKDYSISLYGAANAGVTLIK